MKCSDIDKNKISSIMAINYQYNDQVKEDLVLNLVYISLMLLNSLSVIQHAYMQFIEHNLNLKLNLQHVSTPKHRQE